MAQRTKSGTTSHGIFTADPKVTSVHGVESLPVGINRVGDYIVIRTSECAIWSKEYTIEDQGHCYDTIKLVRHRENGPAVEFDDGRFEYRLHGSLHREGGPAIGGPGHTLKWYKEGYLHREDGPAVVEPTGAEKYYFKSKLHREDGPAVTEKDGSYQWYKNGVLHREDGPAESILGWGREAWYHKGRLHRIGGPALITRESKEEWFQVGIRHRVGGPAVILPGLKAYFYRGRLHKEDGPALEFDLMSREEIFIGSRQFRGSRVICNGIGKSYHLYGIDNLPEFKSDDEFLDYKKKAGIKEINLKSDIPASYKSW